MQLALADQATELAPSDAVPTDPDVLPPEALDPSGVQPTDIAGAPPAPVRIQQEQRVAEAVVAQIQAQEVHLAVVNTPESLPLEVLKSL
jgi:hypothetical protein